jgi:hypothetical protein
VPQRGRFARHGQSSVVRGQLSVVRRFPVYRLLSAVYLFLGAAILSSPASGGNVNLVPLVASAEKSYNCGLQPKEQRA